MSLNAIRTADRARLEADTILSQEAVASVATYHLFLLSNGTVQLFPEMLDKALLVHLLRGEFTVDREAIGYEAYTRDGKTYPYFEIFPAVSYRLAGIRGGLLWLVPRPARVPVAHSEAAEAPVPIS